VNEGIFLQVANQLVLLSERQYENEAVLQEALAKHPAVIAGVSTSGDSSGLVLVKWEMGIPGTQLSLDHLFLDAEAVPILVEVKRSTDTRLRREVLGQMLDYAANGLAEWDAERIRDAFLATLTEQRVATDGGVTAPGEERVLQERLGVSDSTEFWKRLETNLSAGRIRLVFLADTLPQPLVRIIEFLNEQMSPAEVLGVEVKQFVADGHVAYVPQVIGRTTRAIEQKEPLSTQYWNRASFLEEARGRCSEEELRYVEALLAHVDDHGEKLSWGKGASPGVTGWYPIEGTPRPVWNLSLNTQAPDSEPYLYLYVADIAQRFGADTVELLMRTAEQVSAYAQRLQEARQANYQKYPSIFLPELVRDPDRNALLEAIEALSASARPDTRTERSNSATSPSPASATDTEPR
jgi:hypothetical protein